VQRRYFLWLYEKESILITDSQLPINARRCFVEINCLFYTRVEIETGLVKPCLTVSLQIVSYPFNDSMALQTFITTHSPNLSYVKTFNHVYLFVELFPIVCLRNMTVNPIPIHLFYFATFPISSREKVSLWTTIRFYNTFTILRFGIFYEINNPSCYFLSLYTYNTFIPHYLVPTEQNNNLVRSNISTQKNPLRYSKDPDQLYPTQFKPYPYNSSTKIKLSFSPPKKSFSL